MKSIFTKLGTLLLCGAVAMVSCTDFSEDIKGLDNKITGIDSATKTELADLEQALANLEAKLADQYATKEYVDGLNAALETELEGKIDGLTDDLAEVRTDLKNAKDQINGAIADLDSKKADKDAVAEDIAKATQAAETAIANLTSQLQAAKAELEKEIADTEAALAEQIAGVDAKVKEHQMTFESLSIYLQTLQGQVNEINNTLLSLSEYLPTVEAKIAELKSTLDSLSEHLEDREAEVDAKLLELKNELLSLSNHLNEYEKATDAKINELHNTLLSLSAHLEEYEKGVEAKFSELRATFESLKVYLDDQFAAIDEQFEAAAAADEAIYEEMAAQFATTSQAITALANLIADLEDADEAIYEEMAAQFATTSQAITALTNLLADLEAEYKAADEAIYEEMAAQFATTNQAISSVYAQHLELAANVDAIDVELKAQIAAFEALKAAYEAKVAELEATDENLYVEINGLREVITTINNHIEDLRAEDEALYLEINGIRENLTQLNNAINNRIDEEVAALEAELLDSVQGLESMIRDTQNGLSAALNLIAANEAAIAENAAAIADLEAAVEILKDWIAGQEATNNQHAQLIAGVYEIVGEIEEQIAALMEKDGELEGLIGKTAGALQTYMDENNDRLADLEIYIKENFNQFGAAIRNLEAIINDLQAEFGARLDALEERMDAAEEKIADLEDQAAAMSEAIESIEAAIADLEEMDEALAAEIANVDAAAKKALKEARKELQDQIDALVEAKEDLQVRVSVLEQLVAANEDSIEDNRAEIEANIKAISNVAAQLGKLEGTVSAMMQANAAVHAALQQKDADLEASIKAAVDALAGAVSRISAVEKSIEAIYALAETLATKAEVADVKAQLEKQISSLQNMLVEVIKAAEDRANDKINHLRESVTYAYELIGSLTERMDAVEVDVEGLKDALADLEDALEEAEARLDGKDAEMAATIQGLKNLCADFLNMIGENKDVNYEQGQKIAEIILSLTEIRNELADNAEWQASMTTVTNQLTTGIADLWVALDLLGTEFQESLDKAVALLTAEDDAIRAEIKAGLAEIYRLAILNDDSISERLAMHTDKLNKKIDELAARVAKVEVDVEGLKDALADLEDALEEAEARLDGKDAEMAATIQGLKNLCADFLNMIGENKDVNYEQGQKIAEIILSLTEIRNELADNAEWQASMTTVTNQLTTGIADLWVALDLLGTEFQESLDKAVALLTAEDDAIRAEIKAGLAEIYRLAILNDDSISERLAMHTDKLNKKIDELAARVTELVNRVQSVVFVPETRDNFAYIHAAEIDASNDQKESVGYLPRISTIKYKVNAKDAAAVAKEIAANYKAVLDYDVIDVTTRGAAKSGADLEIVNVTSDGQYIFVEVMAKNFSTEGFYANRDDDDGIYSAALVLGDGNNFRSTEYTNLVADVDDAYEFLVGYIDADGMPTFAYDALHTKTFIPCNDNVNVHTAKAPEAFFRNLASGTFLTEAEFASYGYGYLASVEKLSVVTEHDPLHEPDIISGVYEDFPGNGIWEATLEYFHIAENPEFDYNINVKDLGENPWKYKGNYIKVAYEYTVAGVTVDATHDYILANAVIYVNVGTEISEGVFSTVVPWTVALEEAGYNGTTLNAKDITFSDVKWYGIDNLQEVLAGKVNYSELLTSVELSSVVLQRQSGLHFLA